MSIGRIALCSVKGIIRIFEKEVTGNGYLDLTDAVINELLKLKAYGGCVHKNLPSEYTQLEYLESSGTQYINFTSAVSITAPITQIESQVVVSLSRVVSTRQFVMSLGGDTVAHYVECDAQGTWGLGTGQTGTPVSVVADKIYNLKSIITPELHTLYVNGVLSRSISSYQSGTSFSPRTLFSLGTSGSYKGAYVRIHAYTLYDNNDLKINLIPCKRNSDNVLGMYDTVNNTFLTNAGTGTFTAGPNAVPTPEVPMNVICNNGVLKVSKNLFNLSGLNIGTSPSDTVLYKAYSVPNGTYTMSTPDFPTGNNTANIFFLAGNVSSGASSSTNGVLQTSPITITVTDGYYTIGYRPGNTNPNNPKNYNWQIEKGTTATSYMPYGQIYTDGTVETIGVTGNLVEFNEVRINNSTWAAADKTKGFEVYADVYNKSVGDSLFSNGNCFGVYVPCALGKSVSLNFFNYTPMGSRCFYCEVTEDGKCNSTPVQYASSNTHEITQSTFTLTQSNSIGFVFEWWISSQQTRNYTEQNYTIINGTIPPTSYIPYFNGGTATAEMLLGLGDYKDEQEILSGSITRNVGIKVLDGTETWQIYTVAQGTLFRMQIEDSASSVKDALGVLCNSYNVVSAIQRGDGTLSGSATNYDFINNNYTTLNDWTAYLASQYAAGTPVIVVYPLAEPTTETVTGQTLSIQKGYNRIEIVDGSILNLPLYAKYKSTSE